MLKIIHTPAILLLVILTVNNTFSQNIEFEKSNFKDDKKLYKEAAKELSEGDAFYENGMYIIALEHYKNANRFNPNNATLNFKIGKCYLKTVYKIRSIEYLQKAYRLEPLVDNEIRFLMGQAYHLNGDWNNAITEYEAYKGIMDINDEKQRKYALKEVNKKIEECNNGKELMKYPARVFIDAIMEINSPFPEYNPLITADESMMMFTSRRNSSTGGLKDHEGYYYEDVYVSYKEDGKWTTPANIGKPINTDEHDATVGLSPDGQKLFVYRFKPSDGGDIYECELKGDNWSKPDRLDKNINTAFHESTASFSPDGKTMYFVSDKVDDALGGRDIYMSHWNIKKKKWGDPVNLGATINTEYNEEGVFMHPDGKTMFLSSKGHNTMGGYDIFKSVYENGQWGKPKNIGFPINTPDDDVFFVMSGSGKHGYYASAKVDGVGEKDIYMITFLGDEKPVVLNTEDNLLASLSQPVSATIIEAEVILQKVSLTVLKGTVKDAVTQSAVEAEIELVDNQKNEVIATFTSNAKTGKYLVSLPSGKNYGIAVKAESYLFHSENFDIPQSEGYNEIVKDIELKKVEVGSKIILKNIFFDFDKATLRQESTAELERLGKLLTDLPKLKIEISGHTDSKGADDYNEKLSAKRAQSVVDYLVKSGITRERLVSEGYGETQPISTNDTDEGRQLNRRTEFKILEK